MIVAFDAPELPSEDSNKAIMLDIYEMQWKFEKDRNNDDAGGNTGFRKPCGQTWSIVSCRSIRHFYRGPGAKFTTRRAVGSQMNRACVKPLHASSRLFLPNILKRSIFTYLFLCAATLCACSRGAGSNPVKDFDNAELALIQICIDSTIRLDSGLNTGKYLVDFTLVPSIDRNTVDSFLRANSAFIETDLDSLIKHDITWKKSEFFDNPVIRFERIVRQKDGTILINTSKTKASDGSIGTEIILKQNGQGYKCLKSAITWIS